MRLTQELELIICMNILVHCYLLLTLQIAFESVSDELLHEYIKYNRKSPTTVAPSVEDFFQQVKNSKNENVKAAFQFCYFWCFSILLFRGGIRKNNFDVAIKAREQAAGLFYAFRHPKYQLINCLDVAELVQMPLELRQTIFRESMVIPGSDVGQGIDSFGATKSPHEKLCY